MAVLRRGEAAQERRGNEEAEARIDNEHDTWRLVMADKRERQDRHRQRTHETRQTQREINDDGKHTHNGKRNNNNKQRRDRMGGGRVVQTHTREWCGGGCKGEAAVILHTYTHMPSSAAEQQVQESQCITCTTSSRGMVCVCRY